MQDKNTTMVEANQYLDSVFGQGNYTVNGFTDTEMTVTSSSGTVRVIPESSVRMYHSNRTASRADQHVTNTGYEKSLMDELKALGIDVMSQDTLTSEQYSKAESVGFNKRMIMDKFNAGRTFTRTQRESDAKQERMDIQEGLANMLPSTKARLDKKASDAKFRTYADNINTLPSEIS